MLLISNWMLLAPVPLLQNNPAPPPPQPPQPCAPSPTAFVRRTTTTEKNNFIPYPSVSSYISQPSTYREQEVQHLRLPSRHRPVQHCPPLQAGDAGSSWRPSSQQPPRQRHVSSGHSGHERSPATGVDGQGSLRRRSQEQLHDLCRRNVRRQGARTDTYRVLLTSNVGVVGRLRRWN